MKMNQFEIVTFFGAGLKFTERFDLLHSSFFHKEPDVEPIQPKIENEKVDLQLRRHLSQLNQL